MDDNSTEMRALRLINALRAQMNSAYDRWLAAHEDMSADADDLAWAVEARIAGHAYSTALMAFGLSDNDPTLKAIHTNLNWVEDVLWS